MQEAVVDTVGQRENRVAFDTQHLACEVKCLGGGLDLVHDRVAVIIGPSIADASRGFGSDADSNANRRLWNAAYSLFRDAMETLPTILMLLGASVLSVILFRRLALPPILGYLLVGTLIGPHAFNLLGRFSGAHYLAEFGVVFLMFSIGLEFSLPKLMAMKRIVFGLGLLQVLVTLAAVTGMASATGLTWQAGVAIGGALAMSSTAVLTKLLSERQELDAPHGREVMGVLLFQDLAVIPLIILIPSFSQSPEQMLMTMGLALLKALVLLAVVFFLGKRPLSQWFLVVARGKSSELFVLNVLFVTLGLAWLTEAVGLSLSLGAFVAGMLISETEFRHQVEEDIKPFRDVLLGLFFVTVGMMLDIELLLANFVVVLAVLAALL